MLDVRRSGFWASLPNHCRLAEHSVSLVDYAYGSHSLSSDLYGYNYNWHALVGAFIWNFLDGHTLFKNLFKDRACVIVVDNFVIFNPYSFLFLVLMVSGRPQSS